jgi:hypothetical protein
MLLMSDESGERRFLLFALLGGVVLRLMWLAHAEGSITRTFGSAEASRVALAVARGRGIADAYYPGYGPTAHMMPVSPAIAGFLLWLFGPETAASNLALLVWCLVQVGLGILIMRLVFESLGANAMVMRWGTAALCLVTPFITQETIDFRYWDGAAALCLAGANLLTISRLEQQSARDCRQFCIVAALAAATLFVSPPVGFATGACWAVFALTRLHFRQCVLLVLLTAAAIILVFTPWVVRNERAFGEPVLMRSNFGLELAIANHPAALSDTAPEIVHAQRLSEIHPFQASPNPPFMVKPGGEVAYSRALGQQTWRWIAANPVSFAILYVRHLREFFFPDTWEIYFSGWSGLAAARTTVMSCVDLLGLAGLTFGLYRRRRGYWMLALFLVALSLPYGLFEPTTSHMYPAYCALAFLAVEAILEGAAVMNCRLRLKTLLQIG